MTWLDVAEVGQTCQLLQTAPRCLLGFSLSAAVKSFTEFFTCHWSVFTELKFSLHRGLPPYLLLRWRSLVVCPHLHVGDVDTTAAEPERDKDRMGTLQEICQQNDWNKKSLPVTIWRSWYDFITWCDILGQQLDGQRRDQFWTGSRSGQWSGTSS